MRSNFRLRWLLALGAIGLLAAVAVPGYRHYRRQANALEELRRADEAEARFRYETAYVHTLKALETWPDRGELHFQAARLGRCAGRPDAARPHLEAARDLLGDSEAIRLEQMLNIAQRAESTDFAIETLLKRARSDPSQKTLIFDALTRGHLSRHRIGHAKAIIDEWLANATDNPWPYYWRGMALEQMSENLEDQAAADYRRVLELDSTFQQARERLARLLLKNKEIADAKLHFEELLRHKPDSAPSMIGLDQCRAQVGDIEPARTLLDEALRLAPDNPDGLRERGILALNDGNTTEAEPLLRRAHELAPHDLTASYNLVVCWQRLGREREARELERQYLDLTKRMTRVKRLIYVDLNQRPNDPDVLHEIGALYLQSGLSTYERRGLYWLERALEASPKHRATLNMLIEYFDRKGPREVVDHFRRQLHGS